MFVGCRLKGRCWLKALILGGLWLTLSACTSSEATDNTPDRPNIVWIVSEDNSARYLDLYSEHGAAVPAISALAEHGLVFNNAFSNAPVCSVARSTLQSGIYAPQLGTQYHRPFEKVTMPENIKLVHEHLKDAGYYVANQSKTDYNFTVDLNESWDDSSKTANWKNRADKSQPFFFMYSPNNTHEGKMHFDKEQLQKNALGFDLSEAKLPNYFPQTDTFRYSWLYYQHLNQILDQNVADVVAALEAAGELENTFIFYFADHGGVLPRSKGYVYNDGLQVPLVVRVPQNFKHLVKGFDSDRVDGSVEFVDFAPTVLSLAGLEIPSYMSGKPFLGVEVTFSELQQRNESFGHIDRLGAKYNLSRALKVGKYTYLRNYQPNIPDAIHNEYRYRMLAYREWRDLYKKEQLNAYQRQFFEPRPAEMLFNLESDPDEVVNLAEREEYQAVLLDMRAKLNTKLKSLPDLSFIPESYLVEKGLVNTLEYGQQNAAKIADYIDIANLQYQDLQQAWPDISEALNASDSIKVMWGLAALLAHDQLDQAIIDRLQSLSMDQRPSYVIARYGEVLGKFGIKNPQPLLAKAINATNDVVAAIELLNSVVYLHDFTQYQVNMSKLKPAVEGSFDVDIRIGYLRGDVL